MTDDLPKPPRRSTRRMTIEEREARAQAIFDAQIDAGADPITARLAAATPGQLASARKTLAYLARKH